MILRLFDNRPTSNIESGSIAIELVSFLNHFSNFELVNSFLLQIVCLDSSNEGSIPKNYVRQFQDRICTMGLGDIKLLLMQFLALSIFVK